MRLQMHDGAVPFVITYRKILEKPKIERKRSFVGPKQMLLNLVEKAIDLVDGIAFETKTNVLDPGRSVAVHWAIQVEDPWDIAPGKEMPLIATRMSDDMPPCGAHFEVISPPADSNRPRENPQPAEQDDEPDGITIPPHWLERPTASEYDPRPVEPLEIEAEDVDDDDIPHEIQGVERG